MRLVLLLALASVTTIDSLRYDGYRLIEVAPLDDAKKVELIVSLVDDDERIREVVTLSEHVTGSRPVVLAVSPRSWDRIVEFFDRNSIDFTIRNNDLQRSFDEVREDNEQARIKWLQSNSKTAPTAYLRYDEQVEWVKSVVAADSSIASTFSVGSSYEGRDLLGVTINAERDDLPTIWLDANIHAREWISSATALYIIDQILTGTSAEAIELRENYRWYILPNANPDGYEYSWTDDRLWRKTRSKNEGSICTGTDPNRNWDIDWRGTGTSTFPCSDTYGGSAAFSEIETRSMSEFITSIASTTNVFISMHAYSQLWLMSWSAYDYKPADYDELMRVANLAVDAIEGVNGRKFTPGTPPDILYSASGSSFDWAKAKAGITYTYGPELRPATAVGGGFDIPAYNIEPSGAEIFAGVFATVTNAKHKL